VPKTAVSKLSSTPSAVPRAAHVQGPGRVKTDSPTLPWAKLGSGTTEAPVTEPSGRTAAANAQRTSAWPPGGSGARTPANWLAGPSARKLTGWPTTVGATRPPTRNEAVVDGPERQSDGPPELGPSDTLTVYVPSPSNCSSGPAATISPTVPTRPTQYGAPTVGWVGLPSGTPVIVSATCWSSCVSPEACNT
jgi:hypothetical protein